MSTVAIIGVLVVGLLLLAVELLAIPGFGITGILGLVALGVGSYAAWTEIGPEWGATIAISSFVLAIVAIVIFPRTRLGKSMVLSQDEAVTTGSESSSLLGKAGITTTPCRTVGFATIDGKETEVITDGSYLESGTPVRVIKVEGTRVIVEATTS